jgi:hypothetical protein
MTLTATLTIKDIEDILYQGLSNVATIPVVILPLNAPQPANNYLSIYVKDVTPEDWDVYSWVDTGDALVETQRMETYFKAEITCWGANAKQNLMDIYAGVKSSDRYKDMWASLGYAGRGDVQDISAEFMGKVQHRAFFDLFFYANLIYTNPDADWGNVAQIGVSETDKGNLETVT